MASSPTPRDELDEKLNEALIGIYALNIEGEFVPVDDKADVLKDEIKQAFKDAGYMTGQEWTAKFLHEVELMGDVSLTADNVALVLKRLEAGS